MDAKELDALWSPALDILNIIFEKLGKYDPVAVKKSLDQSVSTVSIEWPYRSFTVSMSVRNDFLLRKDAPDAGRTPYLYLRSKLRLRRPLILSLLQKNLNLKWRYSSPTNFSNRSFKLPGYLKPFMPRGVGKLFESEPDTYYFPFGDKQLDANLTLRASAVNFGNAFVEQPLIVKALLQSDCIKAMQITGDTQFATEDKILTLLACVPQRVDELQSLLDLFLRTLDLLKQFDLAD